jgi:tetratricopeptide (TPR) repeat protein
VGGQASTLGQLGILYDNLHRRPEEAVPFFRQAADKYVELEDEAGEGRQRNNLGVTLRNLRRFEEARHEIRRAIECSAQFGHVSEPWKTWDILSDIETDAGDPTAATEAKRKAIECYFVYRRDGGENHNPSGRICFAVTKALRGGEPAAAASLLRQCAADPNLPASIDPFIKALQAIVAGSRDRTLADVSDLNYTMAAEILLLIETLEKAE